MSWHLGMAWVMALIALALIVCIMAGPARGEPDTQEDEPVVFEQYFLQSIETQPIICVPDDTTREHIRDLMLVALDKALETHVTQAFAVWMKDPTGQPGRARAGVRNGIAAFLKAREGAKRWTPLIC